MFAKDDADLRGPGTVFGRGTLVFLESEDSRTPLRLILFYIVVYRAYTQSYKAHVSFHSLSHTHIHTLSRSLSLSLSLSLSEYMLDKAAVF